MRIGLTLTLSEVQDIGTSAAMLPAQNPVYMRKSCSLWIVIFSSRQKPFAGSGEDV
jgi:hypothetical protein